MIYAVEITVFKNPFQETAARKITDFLFFFFSFIPVLSYPVLSYPSAVLFSKIMFPSILKIVMYNLSVVYGCQIPQMLHTSVYNTVSDIGMYLPATGPA